MSRVGRLHLVTDHLLGHRLPEVVAAAVAGGVDTVQVRLADETSDRQALALTAELVRLCRSRGVVCLVDDRVDVALAAGADGVHVGADDLPVAAARAVLGPDAIVGATARDPATARAAHADGATYLGVGPIGTTSTKQGLPAPLGLAGLRTVTDATPLPVIAIGGVTAGQVADLLVAGAHGVAVVGAVCAAADPRAAAAELRHALDQRPDGTAPGGSRPAVGTAGR